MKETGWELRRNVNSTWRLVMAEVNGDGGDDLSGCSDAWGHSYDEEGDDHAD